MLEEPRVCLEDVQVGGLAATPRILAYIVIWLLTPCGFNHSTLTEEDLILMYCLMNKIKVNWVNVIHEHLFKVGKKLEYRISYVILLSQFIEYFEIDVESEVVEEIKALNPDYHNKSHQDWTEKDEE